jgi:hypothetical protein
MRDLNNRIQQLTKLILTSATVDEGKGDESRPASPVKIDFDMSPYQVSFFAISKTPKHNKAAYPSSNKISSQRVSNWNLKQHKSFPSKRL